MNTTLEAQCPHCLGKLELETKPKWNIETSPKMKPLSLVTVTTAQPRAEAFLSHMRDLSDDIGAEFVVGYDTLYGIGGMEMAQKYADMMCIVKSKGYLESVLQDVIDAAGGIWILRLDDDEMVTPAMWKWLKDKEYESGKSQIWSFPEATLFPSTMSFISSTPFWPDIHPRLQTWRYAQWDRNPHGGAKHGPGVTAPVAIAHHKLLVKTIGERRAIWEQRDKGKARDEIHASMSVPEDNYDELTIHPLSDGYFPDAHLVRGKGRTIHLTPRANNDTIGE